ncbi:MAG: TonB family protein [Bacteroidales bacterium]|nr:TonB family protein [Bacteroidales bacterium]
MLEFLKKHKTGILGTIIFHGILALLFVFFGFSTPLPLPAEKGIMINFGNTRDASGAEELQENAIQKSSQTESQESREEQSQSPNREKQTSQEETSSQKEEDIATQDFEDAPAMDQKEEKTKKQQEKENQPTEKEEEQQEQETQPTDTEQEEQQESQQQEEETQPEREVNENALYPGQSTEESGESEGETEGSGNQGRESGSPLSDNHANIDSQGMGGIDFSLQGRNPESLPKPDYNYQVEGKVVVEITVDKYGNVTKAVSGVKGSTTLNDKLLNAAKKAALKAKFDRKSDAPAYQKGTITYFFRLQ